jgi:hypothetical protein
VVLRKGHLEHVAYSKTDWNRVQSADSAGVAHRDIKSGNDANVSGWLYIDQIINYQIITT